MRALVVGGTGLTGPIIISGLIARGYQVTIIHSGKHESDEIPEQVRHIHIDVHDIDALNSALHDQFYDVAFSMYGRLVEVAEALKGHTNHLISVGGECVYKGWFRIAHPLIYQFMEPSLIPTHEDGPLEPLGIDSFVDKMLEAEKFVMQCFQEGHYNVTHFRFTICYGPRQIRPTEWSVVRRILDGRKRFVLPQGGQGIVSRGYGENCAHGLLLAVDKPTIAAGQIYNVCDETHLTHKMFVETIAEVMGHEFEFVDSSLNYMNEGYICAYPPFINYPYHEIMGLDKIKTELGWAEQVAPKQALQNTINWLLKNPPKEGGWSKSDPFAYDIEDLTIDRLQAVEKMLKNEVLGTQYSWRHPYPHPVKPSSS